LYANSSNYVNYTVQKGDTLFSVARNYSINVNSIANFNKLSNKANLNVGMKLKIPTQNKHVTYTVQKGDTLSSVARNHSVNVNSIANLNKLNSKANLNTGMKLKIPAQAVKNTAQINQNNQNKNVKKPAVKQNNSVYTVKKGDTLFSVARNHSVSVDAIAKLNNLSNKANLNIGMKLKIPSKNVVSQSNVNNNAPPPNFIWPTRNILTFKNDGTAEVKAIGLIIFSKPGTEILSSANGTVRKIGKMHGYGEYVVISHQNRYMTVYSNLSGIRVKEGDEVNIGKVIASSNNETGRIHFQIDHAGRPADPLKYLPKRS